MKYQIAEKFKSIQGEGQFAGTPMAFIRFVGCSIGKKICHACDTDFERMHSFRGGGEFTESELLAWVGDYEHVCLTGGEPLDQDLSPLLYLAFDVVHRRTSKQFHLETSGTKCLSHHVDIHRSALWVCVSPKPGFIESVIMSADEVKIIVPGLGTNESLIQLRGADGFSKEFPNGHKLANNLNFRWPDLHDALRWAAAGKLVYLQPRNGRFDVDPVMLKIVQDAVMNYPMLRLSVQMHKILKVQ